MKMNQCLTHPEFIRIHPDVRYELSVQLRSKWADNPASAYFGLLFFDKDKMPITLREVGIYKNTDNVLVRDVKSGVMELFVRATEMWSERHYKNGIVVFNARKDFSDLPNREASPPLKKFELLGKEIKVTLAAPVSKSYPAGTPVRLHSPYGAGLYWVTTGFQKAEWTECKTVLHGFIPGISAQAFPVGTVYVKPFVQYGNWNHKPKEGAVLLVRNIKFKEVSEK